jgi:hypothetical protein
MKKILFAVFLLYVFHSTLVQADEPIISVPDADFGVFTLLSTSIVDTNPYISPEYFDFGRLHVGEAITMDFKLVNSSTTDTAMINNIQFKKNNQYFEFLNLPIFPFKLRPSSEYKFQVKIPGIKPGSFMDSIGLKDSTSGLRYLSFVEAQVGISIINVPDADFGDVTVGQSSVRELYISNTGNADLIVAGYSKPSDSCFVLSGLPAMTVANPLKISPNEMFRFKVTFTPNLEKLYKDMIVFYNNTKTIDSIAYLLGRGVKASLEANGFDWERRRIDRPGICDISPYLYDGPIEQTPIHLINRGSKEVIIFKINIETNINGEAFEFSRQHLINLTIPSRGDILIPVSFHPTKVGIHELTFSYDNSAGSTTKTTLKGIGVFPKLETNDIDFDSTIIKDYTNPSSAKQKIFFNNLHWNDADGTDVSDSTTIDFKIGPKGDEISTDGITWGTEGFRFDKTKIRHSRLGDNLTFPVVVYPGDSLEIVGAQFVAQHAGSIHKASILTITDGCAEVGVLSNWTGRGIDPTGVEEYSNEENIGRLLGYYDILGRRINSIEQYHGLYLEIRMEKNKVLKKIVYKD